MTWHVIRVRSKDAQKQLARTSLSKLLYLKLKSLKINRRIRGPVYQNLVYSEIPHHRTITKVRKYKCLYIKTQHGFSRYQFAKPCHNAKLIVYPFTYRGHMLLKRKILSIVTPKSSIESFKKLNWWSVFPSIIPWCLLGFATLARRTTTGSEHRSSFNHRNQSEWPHYPSA